MSRPTTRGKNKRPLQATEGDGIPEILRKFNVTGEVSEDVLNKLYMVYKPVCQGCRVNSKDNPNCFCGLIPPSNGSRKTGLWQKTSEIVQALGPDPCEDLRASANSPAGLTNLGATCYANSIIQCLYMNKSFREGLFSVEPEVLMGNPVLDQLARLFSQLHTSKRAFIDSAPFIKTLELDNGVQQDSHEFLTLLLSLLERCLSRSSFAKARTVVQDLFRGSLSHMTTCSKCGQNSEASSKIEDFYELELNVKGLKTLDESLDDYLSVEELQSDNQYFCETCNRRVDATRSIKLQTLPNVLNFQLKRYDFLPKTTTRKKISSVFSFHGELDMRRRLSDKSQSELTYDLTAVLIHKGTAANSGHYIAHIKDFKTGQWWKFDDEDVSNLGCHPFGNGTSNSTVKATETENSVSSSRKEGTGATSNGCHLKVVQAQNAESCVGSQVEMFSSIDAYMLTYTRRIGQETFCGVRNMETESDVHNGLFLPSHLSRELEDLNSSYSDACEKYKSEKEKLLNQIMLRRQEVRSILSEAPVHSTGEPYFWVSVDWLRQWADAISPPVLDNTTIQCPHKKVSFSKVGFMKRVSSEAWAKLIYKCDGGPRLSKDDWCIDCLASAALSLLSADSYRDRRTLMKEIAEDVLSGKCQDGTYYVSRSWLQQWVKRKNLDAPIEADAAPTISIICPHGYLMPEQAAGAKRLLVPENLWLFFYEDSLAVKPDDPCSTFPADSEGCSECGCLEDSRRVVKLKQRENHEKLAMGKNTPLFLNCKYYLVPSSWVAKWRSYITGSGKNSASIPEPEKLHGVISSLKCEKHLRLAERPPDVVQKRGLYFQLAPNMDRLTIVSEDDWKCFCEEWDGAEEEGISAIIERSNDGNDDLVGTCQNIPVCDEHLDTSNEVNDGFQLRLPVIRTSLEVCDECIGERESSELLQKLNYSDENIYIYLVRGKEAPKFILEASESSDPERRTSKRSRRSNHGNLISLRVSASTSVYQLKMMIWESLGVVKENQVLHKGSHIIDQESATLADMNIFAGDKLWVKDSEIHEDRDIAEEISGQKMNIENAEEGFRGTLLTANVSSQAV